MWDCMKTVRTKACMYPWVWWVCSWADYRAERSSFPQHSGFPSPSHPLPLAPPQHSSPEKHKGIALKTSKMYIIWPKVCGHWTPKHVPIKILEHQISILEWSLKDHVTLKTGVMMLKTQLCNRKNKLSFKVYESKSLNRNNISMFTVFWANKYSCVSIIINRELVLHLPLQGRFSTRCICPCNVN